MQKRTPDDICFLCKEEKATDKGSHLIPAKMLDTNVGKRNYEESYRIRASEGLIDDFFGRSNLKNTNTKKKDHHYTVDHWFCLGCEKRFGHVETLIQPVIIGDLRSEQKQQNFNEGTTQAGSPFKTLKRVGNKEFRLFFLSVIWRVSLWWDLSKNAPIISDEQKEELRAFLDEHLEAEVKIYKKGGTELPAGHPFIVLTAPGANTYEFTDEIPPLNSNQITAMEGKVKSDPYLLYINEFIIAYHPLGIDGNLEPKGVMKDKELLNAEVGVPGIIGFMPDYAWENVQKYITAVGVGVFIDKLATNLQNASGHNYGYCQELILARANQMNEPEGFADRCRLATEKLIEQYKNIG